MDLYILTGPCEAGKHELTRLLKDHKPEIDETKVKYVDKGCFVNCLDACLHSCRSKGLFRRKLLLPAADVDVVYRLLLETANKQLTGDGSYSRSELLELRGVVEKARRAASWPVQDEASTSTVHTAALRYKEFLKSCNLVDEWSVYEEGVEEGSSLVYLNQPPDWKTINNISTRCKSFYHIFYKDGTVSLQPASDLDTFKQEVESKRLALREGEDLEDGEKKNSSSEYYQQSSEVQCWVDILRLLVNTRDEISLARLFTQTGLLSTQQCRIVRQETDKSNLAMYQYIVSYITQSSLGGVHAPGEEHPFSGMESKLAELVNLMEKIQTKVEETQDPTQAVYQVTLCIKAWLTKNKVKMEVDLCTLWSGMSAGLVGREGAATPARGILGKPAIKLVTGLVDLYSSLSEDQPFQMNSTTTPARSRRLLTFFRTPQLEAAVAAPEDADQFDLLAAEEGVRDKVAHKSLVTTPVIVNKPTYTRYKSSLAWAPESSPVPDSAGREGVRVGGSTLASASSESPLCPSTPTTSHSSRVQVDRILADLQDKQLQERKEELDKLKQEVVKPKAKSRKRILAREAEEEVQNLYGIEHKKPKVEAKKKEKVKKKIATPKGQRKMTSFFTR